MAIEVTLAIPDYILNQAQEDAHATHKPVEEILVEALAGVYPPVYVHPQREQMLKEVAAYEALHSSLVETYLGQYVAIHNGQVVDSDKDIDNIINRVEKLYPDEAVLIREIRKTLPPEIRIRSPRLLRDR